MDSIIDILSQGRDREAQSSKIYGLVVGVVSNNQDPDGLGRVKVKFPWLSDEVESWWARPAKPSAGTMIIHNIDDEVLVGFEHGDVRFPYILGALDNGVDIPPKANTVTSTFGGTGYDHGSMEISDVNESGKNDIIMFRTPRAGSKKKPIGSIVLFDETKDHERIVVASADGKQRLEVFSHDVGSPPKPRIVITNAYGDIEIIAARKPDEGGNILMRCHDFIVEARNDIKMTADNEVDVKAAADMKLHTDANLKADAASNVTVEAGSNFDQKAGANMALEAGAAGSFKGGATLECSSPATTVKGDATLTLMGGVVNIN